MNNKSPHRQQQQQQDGTSLLWIASPQAAHQLVEFCSSMTKGYPSVNITDLKDSWRDGLALCALLHR